MSQRTRISLKAYRDTQITTNGSGLVTAAKHRAVEEDDYDSTLFWLDDVLDEDDMVSNSDAHVPTQQSVKAYADGKVNVFAWRSVSVVDATITLPRNTPASDNKYVGGSQITVNKTIAFTSETNGDVVLFIFDIDAARTFTFPANTRMSDARWESSGANQLPLFDAGKYRMRAEFDGIDWWVEVTGPYS